MLSVEELTAALNDPNSPWREKLLQHLERSPLDPAQAYQQVMQESQVQLGGAPPPPMGQSQQGGFSGLLDPAPMPPLGLEGLTPRIQADQSREANPAGVVNLGDSSQIMPGEPTPAAGVDFASLQKMFEGLGGGQGDGYKPPPPPSAPAPQGNHWNNFSAAQLQTPVQGRMPTLAELLNGRGR